MKLKFAMAILLLTSTAYADQFPKSWDYYTRVHEGTHMRDAACGCYNLAGGGTVPWVPEGGFPAPKIIAGQFPNDVYRQTYLTSVSSSGDLFRYLLDEVTAYSNETYVEDTKHGRDTGGRAGLRATLDFTMAYIRAVPRAGALASTQAVIAQANRVLGK